VIFHVPRPLIKQYPISLCSQKTKWSHFIRANFS